MVVPQPSTLDGVALEEETVFEFEEGRNFQVDADELECSDDEKESEGSDGEAEAWRTAGTGDEIEEPEGNENLRHLSEINANDSDSDNESVESLDRPPPPSSTAHRPPARSPDTWTWLLEQQERWDCVAGFLYQMSSEVDALRQTADECVIQARKVRADAGCEAFRKARLVAATVVGASRRLEAIRAAEPFAGQYAHLQVLVCVCVCTLAVRFPYRHRDTLCGFVSVAALTHMHSIGIELLLNSQHH